MSSIFVRTSLDLACEPSAVRWARRHADDVLTKWGLANDVVDDVLLIVSELATNAVRHAGGGAAPFDPANGQRKVGCCDLTILRFPDCLYVSFYDEAHGRQPVLRNGPIDAESGRGIALIHQLSGGQWGCTPSTNKPGKIVWVRLNLPAVDDPVWAEHDEVRVASSLGVGA